MKKLFNILRNFTSRWSKSAKGGGLGLTTLALAVIMLAGKAWAWSEAYSNTHGGTADWTEAYDSAGKFALTQYSTSHRIDASSNAVEVWGGYKLTGIAAQTDFIYRLDMYDYSTYPRSMKDHVGLRVQAAGSFPTNGYYFYCTGAATESGYWQPTGCTWGSVTNTAYGGAYVWGRYDFRITGSGWSTVVTVFDSIGRTMSAFTNPSLNLASGTVAHGYSTCNYYSGYCTRSNIYVYDLSAIPASSGLKPKGKFLPNSWEWWK